MSIDRTYLQNQRILRLYSDFLYENVNTHTDYQRDTAYIKYLSKYNFTSCFVYDDLYRNVSNLCRIIRLFAVDNHSVIIKNPFDYNGFQLIDFCLKKYKMNCAGCSIILNDILISLGLKSKCICCLPYDPDSTNTHVLVHVYNDHDNKWFVADPALGCVPCDRNGNSMDIITLRNYLSEEDEVPFFQKGRLISNDDRCIHYAQELIDKVFMFISFFNSGLSYSFNNSQIIVPGGYNNISPLYSSSYVTNNTYILFN